MAGHDEGGLTPKGAEGTQLKQKLTDADRGKSESFDPGASMLGTDNEAGAPPDAAGMEQARKAPKS